MSLSHLSLFFGFLCRLFFFIFFLSRDLFVFLSDCLSCFLCVHFLSIHLYVCLSICLSLCPPIEASFISLPLVHFPFSLFFSFSTLPFPSFFFNFEYNFLHVHFRPKSKQITRARCWNFYLRSQIHFRSVLYYGSTVSKYKLCFERPGKISCAKFSLVLCVCKCCGLSLQSTRINDMVNK